MLTDLQFAYLPLDELKPDPRNPRTHSKKQVAQIADSISELGFAGAILINPDRTIIAGHGRYRALKLLGLASVATITVTGLTPDQETLLRIADNKLALNAGWDLDLLKIQIDEIRDVGLDVELTGFSVGEIDVMLSGPDDPDDSVIRAVPDAPVSRTGDLWLCGDHRIACGNLLDGCSLKALMTGETADAVITDPP
jgi:ParB-like chromosome segregation protein Spo0J